MLLKLHQTGQPILRESAIEVSVKKLSSRHIQNVIDSMIETLRDAPGVGLAAPQVGESLRIIVIEDKTKYHESIHPPLLKEQARKPVALKVLINPVLEIAETGEVTYFEGCLSVDGFTAVVPRAKKVKVAALNRDGKPVSFTAEGWLARILQHEVDHLNGILYVDRMKTRSFMTIKNHALHWKKALQTKILSEFKD